MQNLKRPISELAESLTRAMVMVLFICSLAYGSNAKGYPTSSHLFAPADASIYLEINDLSSWLGERSHNPLVNYLRAEVNILHAPEAWRRIHTKLGLTSKGDG